MSGPTLATQTLQLIESCLHADQGATYRGFLRELMPLQEDAYREEEDDFRSHLGASILGRECGREVWYSFRWVTRKKFPGWLIRLFNRGHLEEPRFVALLKMIGCTVWQFDQEGNQFRIKGYRDHYGGGLDSVLRGLPEMPNENVLGEYKTHNDKSFAKLENSGVQVSKPEHYVQIQQYMGFYNLNWALYLATNKNDDKLYAELVPFDEVNYGQYQHRAVFIVDSQSPPPRISNSPGWYKCRFCDHKPVCHGKEQPDLNCRTCAWIQVADQGQWLCTHPNQSGIVLDKATQLRGCNYYEVNPTIKK